MFRWLKGRKDRGQETHDIGGDPEEDVAIARKALVEGDLEHGARHLGAALLSNPTRADWIALLEQFIARAGRNPYALCPLAQDGPTFAGTMAVRAYVYAHEGHMDQALQSLLPLLLEYPTSAFADWLLSWRERAHFAEAFSPEFAYTLGGRLLQGIPTRGEATEAQQAIVSRLLPVLALATDLHHDDPLTWFMHIGALRRLNRYVEAEEVAIGACRSAPGWPTSVALAGVYRDEGKVDAAIAAYRDALTFRPDDVSVRNDIGDLLLDAGRVAEAASAYQETVQVAPNEPWALPSYFYCMHRLHPDDDWGAKLQDVVARQPENERAVSLARSVSRPQDIYVRYLPQAGEACINLARDLIPRLRNGEIGGGTITVTMSYPESPSAVLAMRAEVARVNPDVTIALHVEDAPSPDTRRPLRPVDRILWQYTDAGPTPTLPEPPAAIARAVAEIARQPFDLIAWREPARALARALTPATTDHILAVMVHPPAAPDGVAWWDWLWRVQIAAALVIARLDDDGWAGSPRRDLLLSLVFGPMDWSGAAAVIALADLATGDEVIEREVIDIFAALLKARPDGGAWALESPLLSGLARLPHLDADTRADALARLAV